MGVDLIVDTSVLINMLIINTAELLGEKNGLQSHIPKEVQSEVTYPKQRRQLTRWLAHGVVQEARLEHLNEISLYAGLIRTCGRGESACLALAAKRDSWWIACDEEGGPFGRFLSQLGLEDRRANTPGLMLQGIRNGLLTVEEADQAKELLSRNRFRMDFLTFQDFLGDAQ